MDMLLQELSLGGGGREQGKAPGVRLSIPPDWTEEGCV